MTITTEAPVTAWGDFRPGDLVEVNGDDSWDWELIERAEQPGVWIARENGTQNFQEYHADDMVLSLSVDEVDDPFAEQDEIEPASDEEMVAYIDSLTDEERQALAGPFPVRWLYPPKAGEPKRALNLFSGCGGWCTGLRKGLRQELDMVCIDLNADAVATSNAAGCFAVRADVADLDPDAWVLRWVSVLIMSPPCTDYTRVGKQLGIQPYNIAILRDAFCDAQEAAGFDLFTGMPGGPMTYKRAADYSWAEIRAALAPMTAPTAGLMLEVLIFGLGLLGAGAPLETIAVEQSSALPEVIRGDLWASFEVAGFAYNRWVQLDSAEAGNPSHRRRWFHMISLHPISATVELDSPLVTLANEAIGCPPELEVTTRGNRRTSGGNKFVMGRQIPSLTSRIRSWEVGEHGDRFTYAQIALLAGLPADHPEIGSRTSIAQQRADIVSPVSAIRVLGTLFNLEWRPSLHRYLSELYPNVHAPERLPGLCHPTEPCTHPWPCGLDLRQWLAGAQRAVPAPRPKPTAQLELF
ncbi:hypothetical protein KV557_24855 [Kitasatospora aureofaciens]|uniref:hypothetical protein n=1 Tax=Kitasatospora aureofaciens TaxID=1894 RepID=UPI001C440D1A|nr:hypothetical protein [Kitasatospora aureofaciens]MBV6700296.1 hypothetical protein [Kitasatospora aureofaciens]